MSELEAGPELDRAIVLDLMGWKPWGDGEYVIERGPSGKHWLIAGKDYDFPEFCPSTDIAAAWEVVERLATYGDTVNIHCMLGGKFQVMVNVFENNNHSFPLKSCCSEANSAPLAICRAALKAVQK